ncbi:MAG: bi-domain-containing oxidoreductase [Candidatus Hydrogenedentes bacterium]|nr:bi-domain-containing oxidoreductase [Candidatus Hydrogenedentota bacterium]
MKQVLVKGGHVRIEEVPAPSVAPGMVLVHVSHSLISSGTESGFVSEGGTASYLMKKAQDPLNLEKVKRKLASVGVKGTIEIVKNKLFEFQAPGYSTSGVVVEVGEGVPGFRTGDRVACSGVGYACHAEYNLTPHQLVTPVPDGVGFEEAAFVTLGAIALQGVRRAEVTLGETVVVLGLGLLGQLAAQIARAAGCHVIGCDPIEAKRRLALELGATAACATEELAACVAEWTGGYGADAVIICAASKGSEVTNQAMDLCRQKGRVSVVGAVGLQLQREALYMKELDFHLSCSYGPGRYNHNYEEKGLDFPIGYVRWTEGRNMSAFLRMVAEGRVRVKPLITVVERVDAAEKAYAAVLSGDPNTISALIQYAEEGALAQGPASRVLPVRATPAASGGVGVAVIGAGGFANAFHLPSLSKIAGCRIEAVAARTGRSAKQAAEKYGARYCTTDYRDALADARVQAVVIATRHHLHREQCIAAAQAGKHIFVEKPLGVTVEECEAICAAVEEAGVLLTVGFNRRFSRFSVAAKRAIEKISGPKTILYRCNAGALPPGHWAEDPAEGGGRIVGECVHFFDLCCWFADSPVVSVIAEKLHGGNARAIDEDNLSTAIRFADGSVATVVYCTTGHPSLGKERIEIFGGGGAVAIDDFRGVQFAGLPGETVKSGREDKGQYAIMEHFIRAVEGKAKLGVTAADGLLATRIACEAIASARGGSA